MPAIPYRSALIVGAGPGISAAIARALVADGVRVGLVSRDAARLAPLAERLGTLGFTADATDPAQVERLFAEVDAQLGPPEAVIYNASARAPGPLAELDPQAVQRALSICAYGGFLVAQQAARRMLPKRHGAILFTGASASIKGFPQSAAFAMGKFALRGLAQSAARELGPQGIHVAHVVIDGGVRGAQRPDPAERPDSTLDPDGVAQLYLDLLRQPRNAWSMEAELRPWVERF